MTNTRYSLPGARRRVLAAAVLPLLLSACGDSGAPPGQQDMPPAAVSVVELKSEAVALQRELPGRTRAYVISDVRPLVTGVALRRFMVSLTRMSVPPGSVTRQARGMAPSRDSSRSAAKTSS